MNSEKGGLREGEPIYKGTKQVCEAQRKRKTLREDTESGRRGCGGGW